jgi:release factor glutamine methyltransferase
MNLKQLLQHFKEELAGLYDEQEVAAIFDLLVAHVSGFNSRELALKGISTAVQDEFMYLSMLTELKTGKPVQYILGETWFFGLKLLVNANVLIPRPETEELVEWVVESSQSRSDLQIVDIGTGSGCIAVALKKNLAATVKAVDISASALQTAGGNAALNSVEVDLIEANILDKTIWNRIAEGTMFDVIVSNPPYITQEEKNDMHRNVLDHEPHLALFVSQERPLAFYEEIAEFAKIYLKKDGWLFFEINEHLGKETAEMLLSKCFTSIELKKDMQGKERMIRCQIGA